MGQGGRMNPRPLIREDAPAPLREEDFSPRYSRPGDLRTRLGSALRGLKHALRRDSSYFAHGYRAILIILIGAILGIGPMAWCMLAIGAGLVLVAELARSSIEALADQLPDTPPVRMAREIAAAISLVAVTTAIALAFTVFLIKFGDLQGWWG